MIKKSIHNKGICVKIFLYRYTISKQPHYFMITSNSRRYCMVCLAHCRDVLYFLVFITKSLSSYVIKCNVLIGIKVKKEQNKKKRLEYSTMLKRITGNFLSFKKPRIYNENCNRYKDKADQLNYCTATLVTIN